MTRPPPGSADEEKVFGREPDDGRDPGAVRSDAAPRDNTGGSRDHFAEQRDDLAEQRDEAGGERDAVGYKRDRVADDRDVAADRRDETGATRDHAAALRDAGGGRRDEAAQLRDEAAQMRDAAAELSELSRGSATEADDLQRSSLARRHAASDRRLSMDDRLEGAKERLEAEHDRDAAHSDRCAGAGERSDAGLDRDAAVSDRSAGATERGEAELDRDVALVNRGASATERAHSYFDDLTGAYNRGAGFVELERELSRARRLNLPLVVAFVDVDGLKVVNDSHGHAAGDRMLREVAKTLRQKLRDHDLVMRYGGDEFVCVISGLELPQARTRFAVVGADLSQAPEHASVTVGLAQLQSDDTAADLVARADGMLYRHRRQQRPVAG